MSEIKINKIAIKKGEFSGLIHVNLDVESGDLEVSIAKVLNPDNTNDVEFLKAITDYALKEVTTMQKKHSL